MQSQDTKRCVFCHETKPLDDFYRNRTRPDGRQNYCRRCTAEKQGPRSKRYYESHREQSKVAARTWSKVNRDLEYARKRALRKSHPEPVRLYGRVMYQIRKAIAEGRLVRPEQCEACNLPCKPDAAHYDYEQPLNVRWLCRGCHVSWDRREPKFIHRLR